MATAIFSLAIYLTFIFLLFFIWKSKLSHNSLVYLRHCTVEFLIFFVIFFCVFVFEISLSLLHLTRRNFLCTAVTVKIFQNFFQIFFFNKFLLNLFNQYLFVVVNSSLSVKRLNPMCWRWQQLSFNCFKFLFNKILLTFCLFFFNIIIGFLFFFFQSPFHFFRVFFH